MKTRWISFLLKSHRLLQSRYLYIKIKRWETSFNYYYLVLRKVRYNWLDLIKNIKVIIDSCFLSSTCIPWKSIEINMLHFLTSNVSFSLVAFDNNEFYIISIQIADYMFSPFTNYFLFSLKCLFWFINDKLDLWKMAFNTNRKNVWL